MKGLTLIYLVADVCFAIAHGVHQPSIYGMQALKLLPDSVAKREFVREHEALPGIDFLKMPRKSEVPIELLVAPDQLGMFKSNLDKMQIKYEVFAEDVSKIIEDELALQEKFRKESSGDAISFKYFLRYSELTEYLHSLAKKYSNIVNTFSIGKSFEGRDIIAVKIASSSKKSKPVIVIDAGIHACEWIAPSTALYAINQIVENPSNHHLFEDVDIYVIPSLNPDGYEYTHQNASTRLWRKTRSVQAGVACLGVDANRNFDIEWMTTGASSDPCDDTYAGPKAYSEVETVALRDFMLSFNGNVKTYITMHSYGQYILHPWGFTTVPPKSVETLKCVADKAAAEIFKHRGTRYTIGSTIESLYPAAGVSRDWAMAKAGVDISYTIELPSDKYGFAPPPTEIIPVGRETFDALLIFIQYTKGVNVC